MNKWILIFFDDCYCHRESKTLKTLKMKNIVLLTELDN
jgi:hypothetical protein